MGSPPNFNGKVLPCCSYQGDGDMKNIYDGDEEEDGLAFFIGLRNAVLMSLAIFGAIGLLAWFLTN
jgi:hypothetical protein